MYHKILVPIDIDHPVMQGKAVSTACQLAQDYDATLHFLVVVPAVTPLASSFFPEDHTRKMLEQASQLLHNFTALHVSAELKIQHIVANGGIYEEILAARETIGSDLIVMMSHRPELSDYLLGPNAARVVRHAPCTVMVVRD